MPIVLYLGNNVNEYKEKSETIIEKHIKSGSVHCEKCLQPMKRHSKYSRGIKETGEKIAITVVWCKACENWQAMLPDFLLPQKHYSGNEIESVLIDSADIPVEEIETEASASTVRRWILQLSERMKRAIGILKYLYAKMGKAISELAIEPGATYNELEQVLELAPLALKYSGNKLGLANIWLGIGEIKAYI